jgi:glycosyltransferase involved in cell wall biosynthesis
MPPRKILVLNERDLENPLAGGAEVHIFEIFSRLAARGHRVTQLAASFPGAAPRADVRGVRVHRLANRYLYYPMVPWVARREAVRGGYDVVVDVLNKLPFLSPWFVRLPCFAIVHHLFGTTAFRQVPFPVALVTWLSEKLIPYAYRATPMLAISPSTREDLGTRGIEREHVWVVPPGVDHDAYKPGETAREPVVVWIGRLEPYKRCDVMIDAMAEIRRDVPAARLVVVGEGSARPELEARGRQRGLEDVVTFTGFISEEDKIARLRAASVVVNTSEKEGWGMTVIEGSACGTPSVSTDVPGLRDAVRDGETGLLVGYGDARELAAAVVSVLTDHALRDRLVANGLTWAARFTWDRVAEDTMTLIEEAITPSGGKPSLIASPFGA